MTEERDRMYAFIEDTAVPLEDEEPAEVVTERMRKARKTVAARRRAKRAGLTGALLAAAVLVFAAPAQADTTGVVSRVVDGDTVVVTSVDGTKSTIRILGIDTPETKKPRSPVQCWGPEATRFARDTLLGERVRVVNDPTQDRTDRYGRELAELIKPDGWNYSVEAARAGAARAYVYGGRLPRVGLTVAAAEYEAQTAHRGLWGPPCNGQR